MKGLHTIQEVHCFEPGNDFLRVPRLDELRPQLLKYGTTHHFCCYLHCPHSTELLGNETEAVVVHQLLYHQGHKSLNGHRAPKPDVIALEHVNQLSTKVHEYATESPKVPPLCVILGLKHELVPPVQACW